MSKESPKNRQNSTKITQNDKIIWQSSSQKQRVMKDSTAYLTTNILCDTSKSGTAKRLKDFSFDIASKTGTVGYPNSDYNKEAFNISYTTSHTILTYFGGTKMPNSINGSTYPTMLTKNILSLLYKNKTPNNFIKPESVITQNINLESYKNNQIKTTDLNSENAITEYFSNDNKPISKKELDFKLSIYNFQNKKPILEFMTSNEYLYQIIRKNNEKEEIISSAISDDFIKFEDLSAQNNQIYEYFVRFCTFSNNEFFESNHIILKTF